MSFKSISPKSWDLNPFQQLEEGWMLICAGSSEHYNMMTASWGGFGILWGKPVAYIVVRPSRYTFQYLEHNPTFSLNFLPDKYREQLKLCGTKSGREINKMTEVGLHVVEELHIPFFTESHTVFLCQKAYYHDLEPDHFLDPQIETNYKGSDYHRLYIGEIQQMLVPK